MEIKVDAIGYIRSPYKSRRDIPRQSVLKEGVIGQVYLKEEFAKGIYGYEPGESMIILFNFHQSKQSPMVIRPHGRDEELGIFKTRSPNRPNAIGMTIVKILEVDKGLEWIKFEGVDMLDGSPVLDIKPYSKKLNPK